MSDALGESEDDSRQAAGDIEKRGVLHELVVVAQSPAKNLDHAVRHARMLIHELDELSAFEQQELRIFHDDRVARARLTIEQR